MKPARFVVAVGSGKGGVGKSTVALNLALALSERGHATGVLDADVYGPDIPLMVNIKRSQWLRNWDLWKSKKVGGLTLEPVERFGVKFMSTGFLIGEDQPLALEAESVEMIMRQFSQDVVWGELDYLIVDLPPGTADLQQRLTRTVPLTGAIIVVTPQDAAHLDAKKVLNMYRNAGVKIFGGVENMSFLLCPECGEEIEMFPKVREDRSLWAMGVEPLVKLAFDPALGRAGDAGTPLLVSSPDHPESVVFRDLAARLDQLV